MVPVVINLPDHTAGDTWEGVSVGPVLFNNEPPTELLTSCRMYFRNVLTKTLAYGYKSEATTGFGNVSIDDAVAWKASISNQALPIAPGNYLWDFETTDADGVVRTLYKGVLTVAEDVSHD